MKFCVPKTFSKLRSVGVKINSGGSLMICSGVLKALSTIHKKGVSRKKTTSSQHQGIEQVANQAA